MSEEKLSVPVHAVLDERLPESRVHALWERIEGARERPGLPLRWTFALAFVCGIAAACLALWLLRPAPSAALRLADGKDVPASLDAPGARAVAFNDESRVDLDAAHLDVLESTGHAFGVALRHGTAAFEVHPGGPRTWRVECAGVTVEVVGTHFVVSRAAHAVRVVVERGSVLVRGEAVPDHVVRLGAGESLTVPLTEAAAAPEPLAAPETAAETALVPGARSVVSGGNAPQTALPSLVAPTSPPGGATSAVSPLPSASAFPDPVVETPTVDELFAAADAARRAGRLDEAAGRLQAILAGHPDDHHAALAEFSLGRLYLDSMGDAIRGGQHFAQALVRGLPATLAEDAQARLVEAFARSGDRAAALEAAGRYRALYPAGRRAHDVEKWISASP